MAVPESSRTTRQSARLKPSEELATEEATPSKLAEDVDSEAEAEADADVIADADADATEDEEDSSSQEEPDQEDLAYTPKLRLRLSPPKPPPLKLHFTSANKATDPDHPEASTEDQAIPEATESRQKDSQGADDEPYSAQLTEPPQTSYSPRLSRKRKSTEMKDEAQGFESAEIPEPSATAAKKLKLEEPEPEPESTPNSTLQNGNPTESPQSQESTPDHLGQLAAQVFVVVAAEAEDEAVVRQQQLFDAAANASKTKSGIARVAAGPLLQCAPPSPLRIGLKSWQRCSRRWARRSSSR
jgi:hypothetical protein